MSNRRRPSGTSLQSHVSGRDVAAGASPFDRQNKLIPCLTLPRNPPRTLAAAIQNKAVSVKEVVQAHIDQIAAVNPAINAVVQSTASEALAQAEAADAALANGQKVGPLHGVPFTVKDNIETEGVICGCGTTGLAQNLPTEDAIVVSRIRAAGGILLGKTNLPEVGLGYETDNLLYGRTNNPYDLSRTSGGSSGGEAALIAAGGSPLGLATDGGGSARWPAHCCGIAGIKPTTGRTAKIGHVPPPGGVINPFWQMSVMARSASDLSLALPLICGPDPRDPSSVLIPFPQLGKVALKNLRVAVFVDNGRCFSRLRNCGYGSKLCGNVGAGQGRPSHGFVRLKLVKRMRFMCSCFRPMEALVLATCSEAGERPKHIHTQNERKPPNINTQLSAGELGGKLYQLESISTAFVCLYGRFRCDLVSCRAAARREAWRHNARPYLCWI